MTKIFLAGEDHPRLCGEKVTVAVPLIPYSGSPPPMRGKGCVVSSACPRSWITPAYAGKSYCRTLCQCCDRDHPRLCGEKERAAKWDTARTGSPPPMRGKAATGNKPPVVAGITPAYAGKRTGVKRNECTGKDHPRLCGEKTCSYFVHNWR